MQKKDSYVRARTGELEAQKHRSSLSQSVPNQSSLFLIKQQNKKNPDEFHSNKVGSQVPSHPQ
jgi:hypothetical protein